MPTAEELNLKARETKRKVIETLNKIYDKHQANGVEALYLWGSITTDSFSEENSDVDAIGIVSADSTVTEKDFEDDLANSGIKDFHIRLISATDLETGMPNPKNIITTVMYPTVLLFDMPNWEHVVGKNFKISDFRDPSPTVKDVANERIKRMLRDNWNDASQVKPEVIVYYLKELLRLVHLRQLDRAMQERFSLSTIERNADDAERRIIDIFKALKANKYDHAMFLGYAETLDAFVKDIFDTYKV